MPDSRTLTVALDNCARAAAAGLVDEKSAAAVYPDANLAMLRVKAVAGSLTDDVLREKMHLAAACLEFVVSALTVQIERERAAKEAAAVVMARAS